MTFLTTEKIKNSIRVALFALAILFIGSCKKEYPATPVPPTPEFTFSGTINGVPVNIQAGVNNYYMFTSYYLDSANNIYDFKGEFRDKNCTSTHCPNSLKISIRDYRSSASLESPIATRRTDRSSGGWKGFCLR